MKKRMSWIVWALEILAGSALFALGFDLFLEPNNINAGGISGLAIIFIRISGIGTVGIVQALMNLPLFFLGGLKVGKRFFAGSLLGLVASSVFLDLFARIPAPATEPLIAAIYGGLLCGAGLGAVFVCGGSTGGSDILVRLLKLRWRNVPIGQISMSFDIVVVALTGIVFWDISRALYSGVAIFITGKIIDAVVYSFDYSKVALIITRRYQEVAKQIDRRLDRGATFLYGQGSYSGKDTKVVLTAVKKQQISELKELVVELDSDAFIIFQDAHQVLGDGFSRYSKDAL